MSTLMVSLIQTIFVLASAPLAVGLVRTFKARLQGRQGASPFLPYAAFATMLKKQMVISPTTSWVFRAAPFVVLGSSIFLAAVLPLVSTGGLFGAFSHFVVIAGVLALGAVFLVLGGLDPGSAFGGMGASREMTIASLLEPAILLSFGAFAVASGSGEVDRMLAIGGYGLLTAPFLILSLVALVFVALAENARYPVDNPATHLELTMVHEAMILEYSGPYLAMMEYAGTLKLAVFALLIANFVFPSTVFVAGSGFVVVVLAMVAAIVKLIVVMALLALLENVVAKMRFYRMQEFLSGAFLLALAGMILTILHHLV